MANEQSTVLVGDDTDLLVLLENHFIPGEHQALFFQTSSNLINIMVLKSNLPNELSASLLFIHVITVYVVYLLELGNHRGLLRLMYCLGHHVFSSLAYLAHSFP